MILISIKTNGVEKRQFWETTMNFPVDYKRIWSQYEEYLGIRKIVLAYQTLDQYSFLILLYSKL